MFLQKSNCLKKDDCSFMFSKVGAFCVKCVYKMQRLMKKELLIKFNEGEGDMKTIIDDLLQNEKEVCNFLDGIVERYRLNDFVMVDTTVKDFLTDRGREDFEAAYGCIYYHREKELYLNLDSVGDRLLSKYLDFLWGILPLEKEKDIVRYILAYHYLEMIEQMAFKLTISSGAPFLFWGYEISPQGKKRYDSYNKVKNEMLYEILPCLLEESLAKYSRMFHQYCYENASVVASSQLI